MSFIKFVDGNFEIKGLTSLTELIKMNVADENFQEMISIANKYHFNVFQKQDCIGDDRLLFKKGG